MPYQCLTDMIADRVTIIGVGLIGGSLALALKKYRLVNSVIGYDVDSESLKQAHELGVIDSYGANVQGSVKGSDIVVLATPLLAVDKLFASISPVLNSSTVITDVGSVKNSVISSARRHLGDLLPCFIPGHPISGKEKYGVLAATPELFKAHKVIITPIEGTIPKALELITQMWTSLGAEVITLEPDAHDRLMASTSHLPHMLAYALVDYLSSTCEEDIFEFIAGGFSDFTRIASSQPHMWRDICLSNREELLHTMIRFHQHLGKMITAVESDNGGVLLDIFTRAKVARDNLICQDKCQEQPPSRRSE